MTSMDSLSYETPINLSGGASAKVAYKAGICMLLRSAVHVRPQRRSAGRGLALRLRQGQRQESSAPLPLPVHQGRGGLGPAVADPRSNRALLDAADGLIPV